MGTSVESQAYVFFTTLYGGIIIGFVYDLYRIFRYFSKPKKIATFIEDLIFWIIVSIIALAILIFSNWGEIRGYVFLGFISGAFLYSKLLSKVVITLLVKLINLLKKILKYVLDIILSPFKLLGRIFYGPYMKFNKKTKKVLRKAKKIITLPIRFFKDIKKYAGTILTKK
ncbi:spore cortex biosynthesis protein YabQ [Thermohalobacter berrensis]|uniref:Spore cortex biosynthesis protein YabQ n=1 Tax=Thermohalobacter berrensis TaxID=99594 RepID=A0A419T8T9_9FIRM|nr:spore cortex biosynthesis protein YabQ [Thermohalobacter berrensis]RKD33889.1 spore cortex biosynthesis protein YabQ [Thermohalobacter berrensis]